MIKYQREYNISSEEFVEVLKKSTLAERIAFTSIPQTYRVGI